MTPRITSAWVVLAGAVTSVAAPCSALPLTHAPRPAHPLLHRVLLFGEDRRETADQFAAEHKVDVTELRHRHAASGLLMCGTAHGAAQLTEAADVITTASHVIFDRTGQPRAPTCTYFYQRGHEGLSETVDVSRVAAGTRTPYNDAAVDDWAVARLAHPLVGVTPYRLAPRPAENAPVEFVARGHTDWGQGVATSYESCRMRAVVDTGAQGTRDLAIDCGTGEGSSGGALLVEGASSDKPESLCGVLVGFRSVDPLHPRPFSLQHYNFVVSIEGEFRAAVLAAAHAAGPGLVAGQP